jgi:hypothetical protein
MKALVVLRRVFLRGCSLTALIALAMFIIVSAATDMNYIALSQYLLILAFSMLISLTQEIFALRFLHILLRILIQYAALLLSFLVLFISSGKIATTPSQIFIYIFMFTLIYVIVCAILFPLLKVTGYYGVHLAYQAKGQNSEDYQSRYR